MPVMVRFPVPVFVMVRLRVLVLFTVALPKERLPVREMNRVGEDVPTPLTGKVLVPEVESEVTVMSPP